MTAAPEKPEPGGGMFPEDVDELDAKLTTSPKRRRNRRREFRRNR